MGTGARTQKDAISLLLSPLRGRDVHQQEDDVPSLVGCVTTCSMAAQSLLVQKLEMKKVCSLISFFKYIFFNYKITFQITERRTFLLF